MCRLLLIIAVTSVLSLVPTGVAAADDPLPAGDAVLPEVVALADPANPQQPCEPGTLLAQFYVPGNPPVDAWPQEGCIGTQRYEVLAVVRTAEFAMIGVQQARALGVPPGTQVPVRVHDSKLY